MPNRTTTAAVAWETGAPFTIETVELAGPGPGEVLVDVHVSGLCHTDLSVRDGLAPIPLPAVLGHEGAGVVRQVGAGVTSVSVGDRVALTFGACGDCRNCRDHRPFACSLFGLLNMTARKRDGSSSFSVDGTLVGSNFFGQSSFASAVVVDELSVIPIASDIPLPLVAPLVCGVLTGAAAVLDRGDSQPLDPIVIFGLGTVGLAAVMAAQIRGIVPIIAVDPIAERRALATRLGAHHVIDPSAEDVVERVRAITDGGAQFVVECSGVPAVLPQALDCLGSGGHLALVGGPPAGTAISLDVQRTIGLHQSVAGLALGGADSRSLLPRLIDHWRAGELPLELLVSTFPIEEINEAATAAASGKVIKPVMIFRPDGE